MLILEEAVRSSRAFLKKNGRKLPVAAVAQIKAGIARNEKELGDLKQFNK